MAQGGIHILVGCYTQYHTDISKESRDNHTLYDDEPKDAPRFGADGLADAELMRTLLDGDEHDVRHAHDTAQQGEESHYPEEGADDADALFHLQVLRKAVPYPQGLFVFRMRLMLSIQSATVVLFKLFVGLFGVQPVKGEFNTSRIIGIRTVDGLDGRIRRKDIGPSVLLFLVDAHHLKGKVAHIDKRTDLSLQLLCLLVA